VGLFCSPAIFGSNSPENDGFARKIANEPKNGRYWHNGRVAEFLIITGLSGAGRTEAAATFEDLGWFVIDNMPTALIAKVAELVSAPGFRSASSGVRRLTRSKSSIDSGMRASRASASRWSTALVDPPVAATAAMAFSKEARVSRWSGRRPSRSSWTASAPAARVASSLRRSSAGMVA